MDAIDASEFRYKVHEKKRLHAVLCTPANWPSQLQSRPVDAYLKWSKLSSSCSFGLLCLSLSLSLLVLATTIAKANPVATVAAC